MQFSWKQCKPHSLLIFINVLYILNFYCCIIFPLSFGAPKALGYGLALFYWVNMCFLHWGVPVVLIDIVIHAVWRIICDTIAGGNYGGRQIILFAEASALLFFVHPRMCIRESGRGALWDVFWFEYNHKSGTGLQLLTAHPSHSPKFLSSILLSP